MHPPSLERLSLPARAEINRPVDLHGNTYLHALCRHGAPLTAIAAALQRFGADPNARNTGGYSPLRYAIEYGSPETVALLLQSGAAAGYDIAKNKTFNPVTAAVLRGRTDILDAVLQNGGGSYVNSPGLDTRGDADATPPLSAALSKSRYDMIPALIKAGAHTGRAAPDNGQTPLMQAINSEAPGVISLLVRHGADVNGRAPAGSIHAGQTPLHFAMQANRRYDVIETLIRLGADLESRDARGRTPLMVAIETNNNRLAEHILKAGANPDARNSRDNGETALMIAARKGNSDGASLLLTHKANPLLTNAFNRTAARIAADNPSAGRNQYDPMTGHSSPQPKTLLQEAERKATLQHFEQQQQDADKRKKNNGHKP